MKAIAVVSGGMDSISTALQLLLLGYEVKMLHFNYGQKCEEGEWNAVHKICFELGQEGLYERISVEVVDVSQVFAPFASASSLTSEEREILPGMESLVASKEEAGRDLWVPARNLIFLSIAAAHAEYEKASYISWGANQSETSYPDNTLEFAKKVNAAISYGCLHSAKVVAGLYHLDKVGILKWGHERGYGWVYRYTWSCDDAPDSQGRPCGVCGCCANRRLAFHFSGFEDEQEYADPAYFEREVLPRIHQRPDLWYGKYLSGLDGA